MQATLPRARIGIATARSHPDMTPENWTRIADAALYKAKAAGRDQIRVIKDRAVSV